MKMNRQIIMTACLGLSLISLLSGCATISKEEVASSATDYNLVVEKAQNEMLLLNIVRASKRTPMYFTTSSKLSGTMSYDYETGSINIPFGKFGTNPSAVYSIAPKVSYSTKPTIDVAVLNAKDFAIGLLKPVSWETVLPFWQQGWRKEILLHLFVRSIEINGKPYLNSPEEQDKFNDFQKKLRDILGPEKSNCEIATTTIWSDPIGPSIKTETAADLKNLIEVQKANLTLVGVKNGGKNGDYKWYQLKSKKIDYYFKCKGYKIANVVLRSPEAIFYYLGEIMRTQAKYEDFKFKPEIEIEGCKKKGYPPVPLFVAHKSTDTDKDPYVSLNYEGVEYVIPKICDSCDKCSADRSMHVLELISLLITKQISSGELPPTTSTVITK